MINVSTKIKIILLYSCYCLVATRVLSARCHESQKMNWSKVQIHYIKFHPLWIIVAFVCVPTNTHSNATTNIHITFTDKNSISKIKSCQFGWLLLLCSHPKRFVKHSVWPKHAEQIIYIYTQNALNLPYFHFNCLCCFFSLPFRIFISTFIRLLLLFIPFFCLDRRHTGIMLEFLASHIDFLQCFDTFFLVSCTLINIQWFNGCLYFLSACFFFSIGFLPLNTRLLCVFFAVKRSIGKRRLHISF